MKDKIFEETEQNIRNLHMRLEVEEAKLELLVKKNKAQDCAKELTHKSWRKVETGRKYQRSNSSGDTDNSQRNRHTDKCCKYKS